MAHYAPIIHMQAKYAHLLASFFGLCRMALYPQNYNCEMKQTTRVFGAFCCKNVLSNWIKVNVNFQCKS